jgi:hypothetical protein
LDTPVKIVLDVNFELDHVIQQCIDPMDSVMLAGTVANAQSMIAMTAMSKVDLAII